MKPTELKSVQKRIIKYATGIGWQYVPRSESDKRRSIFAEASADKGAMRRYIKASLRKMLRLGDASYITRG